MQHSRECRLKISANPLFSLTRAFSSACEIDPNSFFSISSSSHFKRSSVLFGQESLRTLTLTSFPLGVVNVTKTKWKIPYYIQQTNCVDGLLFRFREQIVKVSRFYVFECYIC